MGTSSPTARTLALLRDEGHLARVTERWCPFSRRRVDLFGFIDVLAVRPGVVLGVQATSATNHSARARKALALPELRRWLESGATFEVISWRKAKGRWAPRRQAITLADLPPPEAGKEEGCVGGTDP